MKTQTLPGQKNSRKQYAQTAAVTTIVTLVVFGAVLAAVTLQLRSAIRQQIIDRDAAALYPFAQLALEKTGLTSFGIDPELAEDADLLAVALETSELKNVLGVRLYDWKGELVEAVPPTLYFGFLPSEDFDQVQRLETVSRYYPSADIASLEFAGQPENAKDGHPLVEVLLPLHREGRNELLGAAQYYIDGDSVAVEFAALDRNLATMALIAFVAGGLIVGIILKVSISKLGELNRQVEERGRRLAQANADLALASKTSAIGAVTSHFIHGLKNPLAALQASLDETEKTGDRLQVAAETTNRMQEMIEHMVSVLRDEETGVNFEFTFDEIRECLFNKAEVRAEEAGVIFTASPAPKATIDSHRGNLLLLIAVNLIENAIQSTDEDKRVSLEFTQTTDQVILCVCDEGAGLPEHVRESLFSPCRSSKPGGSGLGLALSSRLASHIGAELALEKSDQTGTCFTISLTPDSLSPTQSEAPKDVFAN